MNTTPVLTFVVSAPLPEAEKSVREALQVQGFGILTEVDVQATLRQKLGIETKPHKLLGACNPKLAHASIEADPSVGAFLPCGVALREGATAGETIVSIQNPQLIAEAFEAPQLRALGDDAYSRLKAALVTVGTPVEL